MGVALGRVGDTEPFCISLTKRSVVMAPLHLQSQKLPHKTKWLWKVGPQALPTQIFHKRSPLFWQECLRQGLHCTLEAHESCTFCAGRLIAGKVIKTLQTWRYVWSFTNLRRLNVIKWAGTSIWLSIPSRTSRAVKLSRKSGIWN